MGEIEMRNRQARDRTATGSPSRQDEPAGITAMNRDLWSSRLAGFRYRNVSDLFPVERVIMDRLSGEVRGKRILDIGVGTGRTTKALRELGRSYIGIDYSPQMLRRARERNPEADYRCADARDLSEFADSSFDLVWFSFNGIDYVAHEDRLRILAEIYRVTKNGGYFCFSAHNRDFGELALGESIRWVRFTAHPLKLAYRCAMYVWSAFNARGLRSLETRNDDYALINDSELNYGLLTYYISMPRQLEQLRTTGFGHVEAFAVEGTKIPPGTTYTDGYMIHYLCRKGGRARS